MNFISRTAKGKIKDKNRWYNMNFISRSVKIKGNNRLSPFCFQT